MSKAEFAGHIGVSKSRITAMIASGLLSGAALVGEGRHARIHVETAKAQIASRRHVGQSLGNGLGTRVTGAGTEAPGAARIAAPSVADEIQLERLEFERRRNRRAAIDEATAAGQLVPVDDMRREIGRRLDQIIRIVNALPAALGDALAPVCGVPARDIHHAAKRIVADELRKASAGVRIEAEALPETKEATL